ncbi:MAG: menaquinone biosynthesis decarboxylase [Candidatus Fischerbacteria bacterium RBG_13_37_8]|uniref:Menaquinone biosynthesis decarboxylase n=1 Tax=Candidatus Fischerbacteria bacterium RBG_13_37_8 TaxID=1817863 RepID=A0A1F5VUI4_9BACT|nr:MAG: menaquinone biosynthesis decarboxylase [Candidatus Fischerbacteria bacterium RBG_13_37_8]
MIKDLREYIVILEREKELLRVKQEIDCNLEITEIADRTVKAGGPALLFENVRGHNYPVLINAFSSLKRIALAAGVNDINDITGRIEGIVNFAPSEGIINTLASLASLANELRGVSPKIIRTGSCKEEIHTKDASLDKFPILKCWPLDRGKFITFPLVFTKDPESEIRNCGVYRMQVYDERTTGMHWHIHHQGAAHYIKYKALNRKMEVAVAIGAPPAAILAAVAPLPDDFYEMLFAGFLQKKSIEMVKCETIDLEVPAESEIVLEGYVNPGEERVEGPFGDHTGFYSLEEQYPVFHITCITHRKNPLYHSIIVGRPPTEDCYIGKTVERIFLPLIRKQHPEIIDINMPFEGVFHNLMIVSIKKAYPGHARKTMNAIWSLGQAMFSKVVIVVDDWVNVHDISEVAWVVMNYIDPQRDIQFMMGPVETLEHATNIPYYGSKMGIDATKKIPGEGFHRKWPEPILMEPTVKEKLAPLWEMLVKNF